jgi:uncharacterized protein HemY
MSPARTPRELAPRSRGPSLLDPRQPEALEGLGRLAYDAGAFAEASGYYERALEARPAASLAKNPRSDPTLTS